MKDKIIRVEEIRRLSQGWVVSVDDETAKNDGRKSTWKETLRQKFCR